MPSAHESNAAHGGRRAAGAVGGGCPSNAPDSCHVPLNTACTEMCSTKIAGEHSQPAATAKCVRGAQRRVAPAAARRRCAGESASGVRRVARAKAAARTCCRTARARKASGLQPPQAEAGLASVRRSASMEEQNAGGGGGRGGQRTALLLRACDGALHKERSS